MEHSELIQKINATLKVTGQSKASFGEELNAYLETKRPDTKGTRISVYRWLLGTHKPRPEIRRAMLAWYLANKPQ